MSRADRILARPRGTTTEVLKTDEHGNPIMSASKSRGGWWANKAADLAEKRRSVAPVKSPLDRRIERAIKKATEKSG